MIAVGWSIVTWIGGLPAPILAFLFFAAFCLTLLTSYRVAPPQNTLSSQSEASARRSLKNGFPKFDSSKIENKALVSLFSKLSETHKTMLEYGENVPIKIVSLHDHLEFARMLVEIFQTLGYTVLDDKESATYIFLAKTPHHLMKIRYRETPDRRYTQARSFIAMSFEFSFPCLREDFPSESNIDHFQIELGGAP